jgi:hypothetical protein
LTVFVPIFEALIRPGLDLDLMMTQKISEIIALLLHEFIARKIELARDNYEIEKTSGRT